MYGVVPMYSTVMYGEPCVSVTRMAGLGSAALARHVKVTVRASNRSN